LPRAPLTRGPQTPISPSILPTPPLPMSIESQGRERCTSCNKFVFGYDRQVHVGKIFHATCLTKVQSVQSARALPSPPTSEKIQEVKNKFLQQYEVHRSQSTLQFDVIKKPN